MFHKGTIPCACGRVGNDDVLRCVLHTPGAAHPRACPEESHCRGSLQGLVRREPVVAPAAAAPPPETVPGKRPRATAATGAATGAGHRWAPLPASAGRLGAVWKAVKNAHDRDVQCGLRARHEGLASPKDVPTGIGVTAVVDALCKTLGKAWPRATASLHVINDVLLRWSHWYSALDASPACATALLRSFNDKAPRGVSCASAFDRVARMVRAVVMEVDPAMPTGVLVYAGHRSGPVAPSTETARYVAVGPTAGVEAVQDGVARGGGKRRRGAGAPPRVPPRGFLEAEITSRVGNDLVEEWGRVRAACYQAVTGKRVPAAGATKGYPDIENVREYTKAVSRAGGQAAMPKCAMYGSEALAAHAADSNETYLYSSVAALVVAVVAGGVDTAATLVFPPGSQWNPNPAADPVPAPVVGRTPENPCAMGGFVAETTIAEALLGAGETLFTHALVGDFAMRAPVVASAHPSTLAAMTADSIVAAAINSRMHLYTPQVVSGALDDVPAWPTVVTATRVVSTFHKAFIPAAVQAAIRNHGCPPQVAEEAWATDPRALAALGALAVHLVAVNGRGASLASTGHVRWLPSKAPLSSLEWPADVAAQSRAALFKRACVAFKRARPIEARLVHAATGKYVFSSDVDIAVAEVAKALSHDIPEWYKGMRPPNFSAGALAPFPTSHPRSMVRIALANADNLASGTHVLQGDIAAGCMYKMGAGAPQYRLDAGPVSFAANVAATSLRYVHPGADGGFEPIDVVKRAQAMTPKEVTVIVSERIAKAIALRFQPVLLNAGSVKAFPKQMRRLAAVGATVNECIAAPENAVIVDSYLQVAGQRRDEGGDTHTPAELRRAVLQGAMAAISAWVVNGIRKVRGPAPPAPPAPPKVDDPAPAADSDGVEAEAEDPAAMEVRRAKAGTTWSAGTARPPLAEADGYFADVCTAMGSADIRVFLADTTEHQARNRVAVAVPAADAGPGDDDAFPDSDDDVARRIEGILAEAPITDVQRTSAVVQHICFSHSDWEAGTAPPRAAAAIAAASVATPASAGRWVARIDSLVGGEAPWDAASRLVVGLKYLQPTAAEQSSPHFAYSANETRATRRALSAWAAANSDAVKAVVPPCLAGVPHTAWTHRIAVEGMCLCAPDTDMVNVEVSHGRSSKRTYTLHGAVLMAAGHPAAKLPTANGAREKRATAEKRAALNAAADAHKRPTTCSNSSAGCINWRHHTAASMGTQASTWSLERRIAALQAADRVLVAMAGPFFVAMRHNAVGNGIAVSAAMAQMETAVRGKDATTVMRLVVEWEIGAGLDPVTRASGAEDAIRRIDAEVATTAVQT